MDNPTLLQYVFGSATVVGLVLYYVHSFVKSNKDFKEKVFDVLDTCVKKPECKEFRDREEREMDKHKQEYHRG